MINVQIVGGLVQQHIFRVLGDDHGDQGPLPLTAGQFIDEPVLNLLQLHVRHRPLHALPVLPRETAARIGVDQLKELEKQLKENKFSRRHIICAWNPAQIKDMALPPCHAFMQFYVSADNRLSCQLYQRSADVFLGVPFNIASYSLLTMMLAKVCGYQLGEFIHTLGDAHIYSNHVEQIKEQLTRSCKKLPTLKILRDVSSITEYRFEDFSLEDYDPWPAIKGKIAV